MLSELDEAYDRCDDGPYPLAGKWANFNAHTPSRHGSAPGASASGPARYGRRKPVYRCHFFPFSSGHLSGRMRDPGMVRHVYSATDREQDAP